MGIVRTEYSKELRENHPISDLVPRISLSVDALLAKYDKVPVVAKVSAEEVCRQSDEAEIKKVNFGAKNFCGQNGGGYYKKENRCLKDS